MPSNVLVEKALGAVAPSIQRFCSSVEITAGQVRSLLEGAKPAAGNGAAPVLGEDLGDFAAGKIDLEKFSGMFDSPNALAKDSIAPIERALEVLSAFDSKDVELFKVQVESGQSLREVVADGLAKLGRAFGAAHIVTLSKSGNFEKSKHATWLEAFPYRLWTQAERRVAPPLVVDLAGSDLCASSLAEFLDGGQKIVLVVRGDAPPASLARLITPGVFVQQCLDGDISEEGMNCSGPSVVALLSGSAVAFTHDPKKGSSAAERIEIADTTKKKHRFRRLGGMSAAQQKEDLELLKALVAQVAPEVAAQAAAAAQPQVDPVDKLSAWLLSQANLTNLP